MDINDFTDICHLEAMDACAIAPLTLLVIDTWKCRASHNNITDIKCTRLAAITQGTVYLRDINDHRRLATCARDGTGRSKERSKNARKQESKRAKTHKSKSKKA